MFAYFSKINKIDKIDKIHKLDIICLLLLNNYDSNDDIDVANYDDEYLFNDYTIARWAKEYNIMIMHPYNIVVRDDIPPLFSYS